MTDVVDTEMEGLAEVLQLVPLTTGRIMTGRPTFFEDSPHGRRIVIPMTEIVYEGERLSGRLVGPAAVDWVVESPDGAARIDVQFVLETHDGAMVHVRYYGRADHSSGPGRRPLYSAPVFETSDPRYLWLNKILAVGRAIVRDGDLHYDIYEVR